MLSGWPPPGPVEPTTLTGRFVRVEPLSVQAHGQDLFDSFSADTEGRSWTYRLQGPFATYEALCAWLTTIENSTSKFFGTYVDQKTGKANGMGALLDISAAHRTIELGCIMLSPGMSHTTAATEAFFLQIDWAFSLGFRRVAWTCDPLNAASVRAAQRLGFSYDALFRQAYVAKGRNRDKAFFSIADSEWPALRTAIEKWLAKDNFDEQGMQRSSLSELSFPLLVARFDSKSAPSRNEFGQPVGPAVEWVGPVAPPHQSLVLEGRLVRLERLRVEHANDLHSAFSKAPAEHWAYLPYGPFESAEEYAGFVSKNCESQDPLFFSIFVDGRPEGVASYLRIVPEHGSVEVGHLCFSPQLQRSVAATEAMFLMMRWAFEAGYRRYEWKCNAKNQPSRRAAMRLGLSYEGILRQHMIAKGVNRDTAYFAAVDTEWPALKTAFETWLHPSNFDASGAQLQSLSALTSAAISEA